MNKVYFIELLQKHLRGESSTEQDQYLIKYYNLFESEPEVLEMMSKENKEALKKEMHAAIIQNITAENKNNKPGRFNKVLMIRMAAAAAVLLLICTIASFYLGDKPNKNLSLSSLPPKENEKNRIVRLPDGSTVIVSSGSTFYYPASFATLSKREVYLEGQAYFDIYHDSSKPFIVHTGKITTTVLGTAFNIKAIHSDNNITITVTRGAVTISEQNKLLGIVTRGQQIVYNKSNHNSMRETVDAYVNLEWKEQDLSIDNLTLGEAAILLGRRFYVDIIISDSLIKANRFTTVFLKRETLEQVLKSICEFNGATYYYNKEKASVTISKNKTQTN